MNYAQIRAIDVANGEGIRVSIFVSGCTHNCYNCFNKEYQNFSYGNKWTKKTTSKVIQYLKPSYIAGLSLLGGEPFQHSVELFRIIQEIKKHYPNLNIWAWSGYTYEEIIANEDMFNLLNEVDVLVDGLFVERLKDLNLKFRGSSNQRIIDVKQTLDSNKIVLYMD